jgi:hypothetical protein
VVHEMKQHAVGARWSNLLLCSIDEVATGRNTSQDPDVGSGSLADLDVPALKDCLGRGEATPA